MSQYMSCKCFQEYDSRSPFGIGLKCEKQFPFRAQYGIGLKCEKIPIPSAIWDRTYPTLNLR